MYIRDIYICILFIRYILSYISYMYLYMLYLYIIICLVSGFV